MFHKKRLKNPIQVIRKPDEINKEYSDIIITLGKNFVQLREIEEAHEKNKANEANIQSVQRSLVEKIKALSMEMDESQKHIQEQAKKTPVPESTVTQ